MVSESHHIANKSPHGQFTNSLPRWGPRIRLATNRLEGDFRGKISHPILLDRLSVNLDAGTDQNFLEDPPGQLLPS